MRRLSLIIFILTVSGQLFGQGLVNIHKKTFILPADSIITDSLSIVPGSLIVPCIRKIQETVITKAVITYHTIRSPDFQVLNK